MTKLHEQYISYELRGLLQRLEDPKVMQTIETHPSFKAQREAKASLEGLTNKIQDLLSQIEYRNWWGRIKRKIFPEEFDGRVASLTILTNQFPEAIGVEEG